MTQFTDNRAIQRFEWDEAGVVSFCDYRVGPDSARVLLHVETPVEARGHGAAARLMDAIIAYARAERFKLAPVCSYAVAHLRRRREAHDLLA
jgi:predicted GNAT family acetyltransferase